MANVLVIDDDELVRRTVARILQSVGHEAVLAQNGAEGVQAVRLGRLDLVITDIIMPQQEGIETIAEIREISSIPILAISGSTSESAAFNPLLDARLMGADASLSKPFTRASLLAAVEPLLRAATPRASQPSTTPTREGS